MFGFGKSKKKKAQPNAVIEPVPKRVEIDYIQEIIKMLNCPYEHFPKGSDPQKILDAYNKAFAGRETGGYTPMIIVPDDNVYWIYKEYAENAEEFKEFHDKVLVSPPIDVRKWITEQLDYWKNDEQVNLDETVGEFELKSGCSKLYGFLDRDTKYSKSKECILAKLPSNELWEVMAWLPLGGDSSPDPEEMLWITKYWYEHYNVIPTVVSYDTLEFSASPVKDKDMAWKIAMEQFAVCTDIVFQGEGTIGRLAGGIMEDMVWHFWWD